MENIRRYEVGLPNPFLAEHNIHLHWDNTPFSDELLSESPVHTCLIIYSDEIKLENHISVAFMAALHASGTPLFALNLSSKSSEDARLHIHTFAKAALSKLDTLSKQ